MSEKFKHIYFEKNKVVKESNSKFYKRLIVGMIRFFSENGSGKVKIPEDYFSDIPDSLGFKTESTMETEIIGSTEEMRTIELNDIWVINENDEGGEEENIENLLFSLPKPKNNLKLIKNND